MCNVIFYSVVRFCMEPTVKISRQTSLLGRIIFIDLNHLLIKFSWQL